MEALPADHLGVLTDPRLQGVGRLKLASSPFLGGRLCKAGEGAGGGTGFGPVATERREAGAAQLIVDAQRGEVHSQQAAADPVRKPGGHVEVMRAIIEP